MKPDQKHVLLVEDEYDSARVISKLLDHHGMRTHVARSGHECLKLLETIKPALVIMDLALPDMDGWQTLAMMRSKPETAHIPVVAITAYHSASVAEDARQAGFDAYFSKPLDFASFVEKLEKLSR